MDTEEKIKIAIALYDGDGQKHAEKFFRIPSEKALAGSERFMLPPPGPILEIGAGAGRDAAYFAHQGYQIVAVEPADGIREIGISHTAGLAVSWLSDQLPTLAALKARAERYPVILLWAVWMFLPPETRGEALQSLASLLQPGGRILLQTQETSVERIEYKHPTPRAEFYTLAEQAGLSVLALEDVPNNLPHAATWVFVVFEKPQA